MPLVAQHLCTYHSSLSDVDRLAGASFLAVAFDTEAFETDREAFLKDARRALSDFRTTSLNAMTESACTLPMLSSP